MLQVNEPSIKKSSCSYCGDAPINHAFSFFESAVATTIDKHTFELIKHVPNFIKNFVDQIPKYLFESLALVGLVKFSTDIDKAYTFRSRVIWEEAKKRGIQMEQVIIFNKPLDFYRTPLEGENIYFESIPMKADSLYMTKNWDDKVVLKKELKKHDIPVPSFFELSFPVTNFSTKKIEEIFSQLSKPVIVKPRTGSRGRHTITNIQTLPQFFEGIKVVRQIAYHLIVEEHLSGSVCRATLVDGVLAGFYKGDAPTLNGNGKNTIKELIEEKDNARNSRVESIRISKELNDHIFRSGFGIYDVLPEGESLSLTHRIGRLFGGKTEEMIDDLHSSFIPILEKAAKVVDSPVVGFDCIIPDPTMDALSQKWGIIECNSLPFIDLHYYALKGKPKNIAGMIWDKWN